MKYPVKAVGNVSLKLNQGNTIHLQDVLYVPDLKKNLVSISAMEDKGYKVTFSDGKARIWKNNVKDAFTLWFRVDSLYQVDRSPLGVMSYDTSLQSELLHRRFAHLHYKAVPEVRQIGDRDAQIPSRERRCMSRMCRRKAQKGTIPLKPKQDLRYITVGSLRHT